MANNHTDTHISYARGFCVIGVVVDPYFRF